MVEHRLLPVDDGRLPLTIARGTGKGATVVVVPSAFGIGPDLLAQMEELATDASWVVAIDPFFREDAGPLSLDDRDRAFARARAADRARTGRDVRAAVEWARARDGGPHRVVLVGICFGGPPGLLAAAEGIVDGVVTWHGSRMEQVLDRAAEMRCSMRLHLGGADPVVPPAALAALRAAFAERPDVRIVVHEGVGHGFTHRDSPKAYDASAERAAMASVRELVVSTGAGRP